MHLQLADEVAEIILGAINLHHAGTDAQPIRAVLAPYAPVGSTLDVGFNTASEDRHAPNPYRSHVNWVVWDSAWERNLAERLDIHPRVVAYARNHGLGFEVPYRSGAEPRKYRPDFIVRVDDGRGGEVNLVLEVKGYPDGDAMLKRTTMQTQWIPGVNRLGRFGTLGLRRAARDPRLRPGARPRHRRSLRRDGMTDALHWTLRATAPSSLRGFVRRQIRARLPAPWQARFRARPGRRARITSRGPAHPPRPPRSRAPADEPGRGSASPFPVRGKSSTAESPTPRRRRPARRSPHDPRRSTRNSTATSASTSRPARWRPSSPTPTARRSASSTSAASPASTRS